ncbi:hypothetical protein Lalb_Chr17g0338601 [Lupinus albus]|uniref:Uncharacterized protein n=1 Tax=Lupinus albus TaxID=3870 RepID=A0A6A4P6S6_LUPAL|nr:hypothetical protein Lalb_Chr17g0338601 [Lupinus albus]
MTYEDEKKVAIEGTPHISKFKLKVSIFNIYLFNIHFSPFSYFSHSVLFIFYIYHFSIYVSSFFTLTLFLHFHSPTISPFSISFSINFFCICFFLIISTILNFFVIENKMYL